MRARTFVFYTLLSGCTCTKAKDDARPPVPIAIAHAAYVTNNESDTVSVLDLESDRVVSVPVDIDPSAHEAPHHLAVDAKAGVAFVGLAFPPRPVKDTKDPHAGHGRAETSGKLVRLALSNLAVNGRGDVDDNPGDVFLTHDRTRVLVTHFDMQRAMTQAAAGGPPSSLFATLQVWDAKDMKKLAQRAICVAPHGVITTKDDKLALVACYGSDELAIVDLGSPGLATAHYPLGAQQGVLGAPRYGPYSVVLSPDEKEAFVADLEGADVRVFDMTSRAFVDARTMRLGARVMIGDFVKPGIMLVPLQGPDGVARLDVTRGIIEKKITFTKEQCESPHVIRRTYLVCEGNHVRPGAVLDIDPDTLDVKRRWSVGVYPDGIAFGND